MSGVAAIARLSVVDNASVLDPIERFGATLTNQHTRRNYTRTMRHLFRNTGAVSTVDLDEAAVIAWCCEARANNTARARMTTVRTFLVWCQENDVPVFTPTERLWKQARRQRPKTYGKVQGRHPARWLDRDQAFDSLCGACRDGTDTGLRDEIIVRLGLSGVRVTEIGTLTIGAVDLEKPLVSFIGKGNKPRRITPGETLVALLREYLRHYEQAVGTLRPDMPLTCQERRGTRTHGTLRLDWGRGYAVPANSLHQIILRRATQARLGHIAPHDLRRTAAGILHRSTDEHGAHFFDLLDIQQVLDHADPATTMRSYLEPMNTGVKDRAAGFLD